MKPAPTSETYSNDDSIMAMYLREVARYHPLRADEEAKLAVKIREGNPLAVDRLVKANLRFVISVARSYQGQGVDLLDLINVGNLGLLRAATKFDEKKNFKFISYAVWWIRQAILQTLAEQSRLFKIPINRIAEIYKVGKVEDKLEQQLQRKPQSEDIATALSMSARDIDTAHIISQGYVSLNTPVGGDGVAELVDFIYDKANEIPDEAVGNKMLQKSILSILDLLKGREKEVIIHYFGLFGIEAATLEEIGTKLRLTRERVRQIKDRALLRMRKLYYTKNLYVEQCE